MIFNYLYINIYIENINLANSFSDNAVLIATQKPYIIRHSTERWFHRSRPSLQHKFDRFTPSSQDSQRRTIGAIQGVTSTQGWRSISLSFKQLKLIQNICARGEEEKREKIIRTARLLTFLALRGDLFLRFPFPRLYLIGLIGGIIWGGILRGQGCIGGPWRAPAPRGPIGGTMGARGRG